MIINLSGRRSNARGFGQITSNFLREPVKGGGGTPPPLAENHLAKKPLEEMGGTPP